MVSPLERIYNAYDSVHQMDRAAATIAYCYHYPELYYCQLYALPPNSFFRCGILTCMLVFCSAHSLYVPCVESQRMTSIIRD